MNDNMSKATNVLCNTHVTTNALETSFKLFICDVYMHLWGKPHQYLFCRDRVLNLIRANNCPRGPGPTMKTGNQYKKKIVAEVCTLNVKGDD